MVESTSNSRTRNLNCLLLRSGHLVGPNFEPNAETINQLIETGDSELSESNTRARSWSWSYIPVFHFLSSILPSRWGENLGGVVRQ
ncbi:hypothetical protein SOVF_107810 [Spinacia oleracea]|nr:hypothetical protein SOVF_107810 [Spinacia oleracea]